MKSHENEFLDFFKHLLNFTAYFLVHQLQSKIHVQL